MAVLSGEAVIKMESSGILIGFSISRFSKLKDIFSCPNQSEKVRKAKSPK